MTTRIRLTGGGANAGRGTPVYSLHIMTHQDVGDVSRVERRCFPNPWPASAYRRELQNPAQNFYVVLRARAGSLPAEHVANGSDPISENDTRAAVKALPRRSLLPIGLGRRQESGGGPSETLIGFAGMWFAFDEAHITTIGIDPLHRGHGLGELLLLAVVDEAIARGANWLTLEVRISNVAAQTLYRKYGFTVHGTRRRYYSDNNEDALIMWSRPLSDPSFRAEIELHRATLSARLGARLEAGDLAPFSRTAVGARSS